MSAWSDTNFGRDDGIRCACGGSTYLVDDQGYGLIAYQCDVCDESFQVQYDVADEDADMGDGDYWEPVDYA